MTRYSIVVSVLAIAVLSMSCDKQTVRSESKLFVAAVMVSIDGEWLHVEVQEKDTKAKPRRVMGVARSQKVDLHFVDDSTLAISNIRSRLDGYPVLITNLQCDNVQSLTWPGSVPVILNDTTVVERAEKDGWRVSTQRLNKRSDVLVLTLKPLPSTSKTWGEAVVLLGADDIKIDSLNNCVAFVSCRWIGSDAMQHFKFDVTDDRWPPVISLTE